MTGPRTDAPLHQAYFGWSRDRNQVSVLAHSFEHHETAERWFRFLEGRIRLQPVPDTVLPASALSYFHARNGNAVVLRRIPGGKSAGRNDSHALIGPAHLLTTEVALGLSRWNGWENSEPIAPMRQAALSAVDLARATAQRIGDSVRARREAVITVLGRLLADPARPVSIVGARPEDQLPIVWALAEIAGSYRPQRLGRVTDWTFSTYEDRHDVSQEALPRVIFLPALPPGAGVVERTIVDMLDPRLDAGLRDEAGYYVDELLKGVPPEQRDPVPARAQAEPEYAVPARAPAVSRENGGGTRPGVARPVTRPGGAASGLLGAGTVRQLTEELGVLAGRSSRQYRDALRAALPVATLDQVTRQIEIDVRQELLEELLAALYGPRFEDLTDPAALKHAALTVRDGESEQVTLMLGAARRNDHEKLREAAYHRWAGGGRRGRPEPGGVLLRRLRAQRYGRYLPVAVLVAAVALLGLVFLGGYLVAGTTGNPDPAAAAAVPVPFPPPPGPAPVAAIVDSGQAVLTIQPGRQVFAFVKAAAGYYPQQACAPVGDGLWECGRRAGALPDQPELVAVDIPLEAVPELAAAAERGRSTGRQQSWGTEVPVVPHR